MNIMFIVKSNINVNNLPIYFAISLSMPSFGLQYKYDGSAHCTSNTMLFKLPFDTMNIFSV